MFGGYSGSGEAKVRMVVMIDTGATRNVMNKRVYDRLKTADAYMEPVGPLVGNLKSAKGLNFDISGGFG